MKSITTDHRPCFKCQTHINPASPSYCTHAQYFTRGHEGPIIIITNQSIKVSYGQLLTVIMITHMLPQCLINTLPLLRLTVSSPHGQK